MLNITYNNLDPIRRTRMFGCQLENATNIASPLGNSRSTSSLGKSSAVVSPSNAKGELCDAGYKIDYHIRKSD
jgi:hypothetical protein